MQAISREYLLLFNAITDTEEALCQLRGRLIEAQRQAEELFLEAESKENQAAAGGCPYARPMGRAPSEERPPETAHAPNLSGARP